jgi:hypothetical protein
MRNFVILDEDPNVFRFANQAADEYLETSPHKVVSRAGNAKFCVSLLCTPETWEDYDQGLNSPAGPLAARRLLGPCSPDRAV